MVDIRQAVLKRKLAHALASAVKLYASEASSEDQRSIVSGQIKKRGLSIDTGWVEGEL